MGLSQLPFNYIDLYSILVVSSPHWCTTDIYIYNFIYTYYESMISRCTYEILGSCHVISDIVGVGIRVLVSLSGPFCQSLPQKKLVD